MSTKTKPRTTKKVITRTVETEPVDDTPKATPPLFEGMTEHPPSSEKVILLRVFQTHDGSGRPITRKHVGKLPTDATIEELEALCPDAGTVAVVAYDHRNKAAAAVSYSVNGTTRTNGSGAIEETASGLVAIKSLDPIAQLLFSLSQQHQAQIREDHRNFAAQLTDIMGVMFKTLGVTHAPAHVSNLQATATPAVPPDMMMKMYERLADLRVEVEKNRGKGMDKLLDKIGDNIGSMAAVAMKVIDPDTKLAATISETAQQTAGNP